MCRAKSEKSRDCGTSVVVMSTAITSNTIEVVVCGLWCDVQTDKQNFSTRERCVVWERCFRADDSEKERPTQFQPHTFRKFEFNKIFWLRLINYYVYKYDAFIEKRCTATENKKQLYALNIFSMHTTSRCPPPSTTLATAPTVTNTSTAFAMGV